MKSYKCILIGALLCCSVALGQNWDQWKLQYSQPATQWTEALPVGNGHMGAMVFGDPDQERIQFNEDTVWAGEPMDYVNPKADPEVLAQVRRLLLAGSHKEAGTLARNLLSKPVRQMPLLANSTTCRLTHKRRTTSGTNDRTWSRGWSTCWRSTKRKAEASRTFEIKG